jgi:hypothetical protein
MLGNHHISSSTMSKVLQRLQMVPVAGANPVKFAVLGIRTAWLLVTYLLLTACVISPLSRTNAESSNGVRLKGYTLTPGQAITIQAVDQNTGNLDTRGTAAAATSGTS